MDELKEPAGAVVGQLIKSAANDPKLKQAGEEFAGAILTVARAVNVALLPLAAANYGYDKARAYFQERFGREMAQLTATIPSDEVVLPKASVAGPAVHALAFTHEEPDLKAMYLNLLATAMDGRRAAKAHPAFVEIIKQLTAQEACLLRRVLAKDAEALPLAQIQLAAAGAGGYEVLRRHLCEAHLMKLDDTDAAQLVPSQDMEAIVENWARLGLVTVDYTNWLSGDATYAWAYETDEVKDARVRFPSPLYSVQIGRGCMAPAAFGMQFASAVGLH